MRIKVVTPAKQTGGQAVIALQKRRFVFQYVKIIFLNSMALHQWVRLGIDKLVGGGEGDAESSRVGNMILSD